MPAQSLLRHWLAAYQPRDADERAFHDRMLSLAADDASPFARTRFSPGHFTASAFVVDPAGVGLLLIFHRKLTRWLQPGGHIEAADNDLLAAARREVGEETGLPDDALEPVGDGIFDIDIHPIPAHGVEPAHEHFDVRFAFRCRTQNLAPGAEVAGARWVALNALASVGCDGSILRAAKKIAAL